MTLWCALAWSLGAYAWAQKTLKDHAKDKRPYLYTREQLEEAKTHDQLWNAAQVREASDLRKCSPFQQMCIFVHVSFRWSVRGRCMAS